MHPYISFFESVVRSGHSTGTNQDHYVDRCNIAIAMPGGLALNKWKDVHGVACPPRISCLTDMEIKHALNMVDLLFVVTHVDFLADGVLCPVLICAFAALIMYYPQTSNEFGMDHVLSAAIRNAAIAAGICTVSKESNAHNVLIDWARRIKDNFKQRNKNTKVTDSADLLPVLNNMCNTMNTMETKIYKMMTALTNSQATIRTLQDQLTTIQITVNKSSNEQKRLQLKMGFLKTPPDTSLLSPSNWNLDDIDVASPDSPVVVGSSQFFEGKAKTITNCASVSKSREIRKDSAVDKHL